MRLHVVTGDYAPGFTGGVASWTERVAHEAHRRGVEVLLHARGARLSGRAAELRHDAAHPFALQRIRARQWNRNQASAVAAHLAPQLRRGDLVLASTWPLAPGLVEPCRALGIPLITVAHGSEVTRLTEPPPQLRALASYARFGAVSGFLVRRLRDLGVRATLLPAPVDLVPSVPGPEEREGVLVVARCTELKGIDRALGIGEALGWPVTVVGEGPAMGRLARLARELRVAVRFEGRLSWPRTVACYQRSRLLLQPSREDDDGMGAEGLGLVVLEAIAHGCPAAVSAVGGLPEAVGPGLILEAPDDPVASAAALRRWLGGGPLEEQRAWLAGRHGTGLCLDALLDSSQDSGA